MYRERVVRYYSVLDDLNGHVFVTLRYGRNSNPQHVCVWCRYSMSNCIVSNRAIRDPTSYPLSPCARPFVEPSIP